MPKIDAANLELHREQIRLRVFDAFASLMAERSYDAITMAQLAARAGIGRTAIYHHFPDKEAVVVAFATHQTEQYVAHLQELLADSDDPAERLRIYVRNHLDSGERFHMGFGPQLYRVLPDTSREAIREHVQAVEAVLRDILETGAATGRLVVGDVEGTMSLIHACLGPRYLPPETIESFVLRAVGAAGRGGQVTSP